MNELHAILKDLIETLQQQAKCLEKLAVKVEQQTSLRDSMTPEVTAVHAELSELHRRIEKVAAEEKA